MRIAIGSIFIECNHFGGVPADLETFARCELWRGAEVLGQQLAEHHLKLVSAV